MKQVIFPTDPAIKIESSKLAADAAAGSNVTLTLENNDGFANTDFIAIGYEGAELCELEQINQAISGATDARVATLKFNHQSGEPVVKYRFDKRKLYGATSADGSYSELTAYGSPAAIQVDDPHGTVLEYDGGEGYAYFKATYYNSESDEETDLADAEAVEGDEAGRYATLYDIRKHAGLSGNAFYSDYRLEAKRKQAESEINSTIMARYTLPLSEVPALISRICILLAAGYVDYEEFGGDGQGVKWLGEARALLKSIANGTQRLLDSGYIELPVNVKVNEVSGYPDDTAGNPTFSMADRY